MNQKTYDLIKLLKSLRIDFGQMQHHFHCNNSDYESGVPEKVLTPMAMAILHICITLCNIEMVNKRKIELYNECREGSYPDLLAIMQHNSKLYLRRAPTWPQARYLAHVLANQTELIFTPVGRPRLPKAGLDDKLPV